MRINLKRSLNRIDGSVKEYSKIKDILEEIYHLVVERVALTTFVHGQNMMNTLLTPVEKKNSNFFSHTMNHFDNMSQTLTRLSSNRLNELDNSLAYDIVKYTRITPRPTSSSLELLAKIRSDPKLQKDLNQAIEGLLVKDLASLKKADKFLVTVHDIENKLTKNDQFLENVDLTQRSIQDMSVISVKDGNMRFELQEISKEFLREDMSPSSSTSSRKGALQRSQSNTETFNLETFDLRERSSTNKPYILTGFNSESKHMLDAKLGFDSFDDLNVGALGNSPRMNKKEDNVTSLNKALEEGKFPSLNNLI